MKFFNTAWRNIRRSPYQALSAILIMSLTFLVISFFVFLLVGSSKIITFFESKPQVTAFFNNEASQEEINSLQNQLSQRSEIASIKFVSKEQALEIYKEQNKDDPLLLDLVTAEVLPASFEISAVNIEDLAGISETLKQSPIVSEVIFQRDVISALTSWTNALRQIGFALIIILSTVSVFIMVTIIGIKISHKKEDIEIMKLIGASSWYIRWPFIIEGVTYGVVGALIGWTISVGVLLYSTPFLSSFLKGIPVLPVTFFSLFELLVFELLLASMLGIFASYIAVLRYLKA
jgi:cell division transport system permease protein